MTTSTANKLEWMDPGKGKNDAFLRLLEASSRGDTFAISQILDEQKQNGITVNSSDPMRKHRPASLLTLISTPFVNTRSRFKPYASAHDSPFLRVPPTGL